MDAEQLRHHVCLIRQHIVSAFHSVSESTHCCCCCSAYGGYVLGLGTTIVVMNVFEAAQPALLYIVPAVLASVLGHAAINKQFLEVNP